MIQKLPIFALRLNVLEEGKLKEMRLQEDVDQRWPHLHNGHIEEEYRPKDWQMSVIVNTSKAIVLFVGQILDTLVIDTLFELPHIFYRVLEYLWELWVISSHPLRFPSHLK